MADGPKTGRRASPEECAHARKWVELYRLAEQSQDGRYCVNPEAPHEERCFICADDPEPLLLALLGFAENGTFQAKDTIGIQRLIVRAEIGHLRNQGKNYGDTIAIMAERRHCSTRKIERMASVTDKP
jgi:hypothetical protein